MVPLHYLVPLLVLPALLGYQLTSWLFGKRIFDSLNSEAMLFTFLMGTLALMRWWAKTIDDLERRDGAGLWSRWLMFIFVGFICGGLLRIKFLGSW